MTATDHRGVQEILLNRILRLLGYIIVPVLLVNLSRYFILGWLFSFNVYIVSAFAVIFVAARAVKLTYSFKVFFLLLFFLGLAVTTGMNFGMVSFMAEFLLIAVLISVIFLEKKSAIFVYILCGFLCICSAVLCITGVLPLVPDFEKHVDSIPSWSSFVVTFLFMASMIILIAGNIGNLLAENIKALKEKNVELERANNEVSTLQGILPICANCKKVRDEKGYWHRVEAYIADHSAAEFTHGLCSDCAKEIYGHEDWFTPEGAE